MEHTDNIICLKGIGEKTSKLFQKIGIQTVDELIHHYPRDYQTFEDPCMLNETTDGEICTVSLSITNDFKWKKIRNLTIGTGMGSDGQDYISLTYFNVPYLKGKLTAGMTGLFRGKIKKDIKGYHMDQPQIYSPEEYGKLMGRLHPCYNLTAGLTNHMITKAVAQVVNNWNEREYLPSDIEETYQLLTRNDALKQIHFPENMEKLLAARKRLVFDEFFIFLVYIRRLKEQDEGEQTDYPMLETPWPKYFLEKLPYKLTTAQERVWDEVCQDLTAGYCMNRLIQGDVGSGKTILAFLSLLLCVTNGYQGALMAPTELLATQHFEQLQKMIKEYDLPLKPVLLTGSLSAGAKRELYQKIESGEANVVIGTHALIQEKVHYDKLALVITDEQHRFGVRQRETLSGKGGRAHVLVMSATPIPRTLAIILYGDLHLSMVDELPANRLPIKNCVVDQNYRKKAYEFIVKQVNEGHQAYIICPMVEESEGLEGVENVTDYTLRLRSSLPAEVHVEALHGKMKPQDKKRIMEEFAAGNIHVLVSTTVIEVGINVPEATVMMVENAERFGLAQLHQLRGRIGRGNAQSYCIFVNGNDKKDTTKRLDILNHSNDGFYIAEEDLKLRGPGDLFGIRQSGSMEFKIADIYQDAGLLKQIAMTVNQMLLEDRELKDEKYTLLKQYLEENEGNFIDFRSI